MNVLRKMIFLAGTQGICLFSIYMYIYCSNFAIFPDFSKFSFFFFKLFISFVLLSVHFKILRGLKFAVFVCCYCHFRDFTEDRKIMKEKKRKKYFHSGSVK